MSTILCTVNYRLVIPLSLGDRSTATNKAAEQWPYHPQA